MGLARWLTDDRNPLDIAEEGHIDHLIRRSIALGAPVESVYKTLVVIRETPRTKPLLVMVAANKEIDLRALAKSMGEKKLRMATQKEAEQLTGLQVGGISALALLNKGFEICIDRPALDLGDIHISGGTRGLDIKLAVKDLIALTSARTVDC